VSANWYLVWGVVLLLGNLAGLAGTLFGLPGNWLIVLLSALFAWLVHGAAGEGLTWWSVGGLVLLAVLGVVLEFAIAAAGAAKQGASRRAMVLSMLAGMAGALLGSAGGNLLIPVVGTIPGAILGGAAGAFVGALAGESWKGSTQERGFAVGTAAFVGRLLGTFAKLTIAVALFAIATLDTFWN
jgi:hypothetical protein